MVDMVGLEKKRQQTWEFEQRTGFDQESKLFC